MSLATDRGYESGRKDSVETMITLSSNLRYRIIAIGDKYHWIDRVNNEPITYENGEVAQFNSLDDAIDAFVEGKLTVKKNEVIAH
jgi:hypothetical protein